MAAVNIPDMRLQTFTLGLFALLGGVAIWRWTNCYALRQYSRPERFMLALGMLTSLVTSIANLFIATENMLVLSELLLLIMLSGAILANGIRTNPDRFRWEPTGEVPQVTRTNVLSKLSRTKRKFARRLVSLVPVVYFFNMIWPWLTDVLSPLRVRAKVRATDHPVRYAMWYEPRDAYLTKRVEYTMQQYGHTKVNAAADADYQMVFITYDTPASRLDEAIKRPTTPIFLLAAPINLDGDSPAAKFQWLDYRRRSQALLNSMGQILRPRGTLTPEERLSYGETFLPLNFQSRLLPQGLFVLLAGMRLLGLALWAFSLVLLAMMWRDSASNAVVAWTILAGVGTILIVGEHRIRIRKASLTLARVVALLPIGALLVVSTYILAVVGCCPVLSLIFIPLTLLATENMLRLWLPSPGPPSAGPYIGIGQ